jgi:hypothetical protein
MKKLLLLFLLLPFFVQAQKVDTKEVLLQLVNNLHGGVEVHTVDGRQSYYVYGGTGYKYYFYKQTYFFPQVDFKWGQYRYDTNNSHYTETSSLAFPLIVGYDLPLKDIITANIYGGVRYEQILYISHNTYTSKVNKAQAGLLGGASIKLANRFGVTVSYYYGLTSLYQDGTGRTSSFNFAFLF